MRLTTSTTVTVMLAGTAMSVFLLGWRQMKASAASKADVKQISADTTERRSIVAAGRVEPASEEVKIGSELDGKLRAVPVEEGQEVRRGQVIAILENGDYLARVELAKAALSEREANLERLRNGSRLEERREAEAQLREAEVHRDIARAERERRRSLLDRGAISRSEFDHSDRDARSAEARVEAVKQRLQLVETETRVEDLKRAAAEVERARASIREAEALVAKTIIRAPIDGRILRKHLKAGEAVSSNGNTTIVTMGDVSRLRVRVDVDEIDVAKLFEGQQAYVTAEAYGNRQFKGRVVRIGQALGRKNVRTGEPSERVDTKILETLVELNPGEVLPVGLRVDAYLELKR